MRCDLVRAATGRTGGAVTAGTLGEGVGVLWGLKGGAGTGVGLGRGPGGVVTALGITLGEFVGVLAGGSFAGAAGATGGGVWGRRESGFVESCHLLKMSRRLSMAMS
jgi:hypothetical protein